MEWNDEVNEEPGVAEALPSITGDGREQAEAKEENPTNGAEENEWDRLLRVRYVTSPFSLVPYFCGFLCKYFLLIIKLLSKPTFSGIELATKLNC